MAPPLFKDFSKEASDLLSKNYAEVGSILIENKVKGPDATVFVAPQLEKSGPKFDIQYNVKAYGLKTKVGISPKSVIPDATITYESGSHTLELAQSKKQITYDFKSGVLAIQDRITPETVACSIAYEPFAAAAVGAGVSYDLKGSVLNEVSGGAVYACSAATVSIQVAHAKGKLIYDTAVIAPLNLSFLKNLKLALTARCSTGSAKVTAGAEFTCPITGSTIRAKVDNAKVATLSVIRKFGGGWTAAFSTDSKSCGFGIKATCDC